MHRSFVAHVATVALLGVVVASAEAADPTDKRHSGKLKESAKHASCRLKAESKAVLTATLPDFSKCVAKFPSKFNDIETNAGPGICPSEGDGSSINGWITRDSNDISTLLAGGTISRLPASGHPPAAK